MGYLAEFEKGLKKVHSSNIEGLEKAFKDIPQEKILEVYSDCMKILGNLANFCPLALYRKVEEELNDYKNKNRFINTG